MTAKVLTLGFHGLDLTDEQHIFIRHSSGISSGMTPKEYYMQCMKMVEESDVLILEDRLEILEEDEIVMIHSAYTTHTPIFKVGTNPVWGMTPTLEFMITNQFKDLDELNDHLNVYYGTKFI